MRTVALVLILTVGAAAEAAPSVARADRRAPCAGPRFRTDGVTPRIERAHAKRVIRCVFHRVAPGQAGRALDVARCESGFNDEASNGGEYLGLFQHARRYWPGRARALPTPPFSDRVGAFHAQANTWAAARLVRSSGWGPWGCA